MAILSPVKQKFIVHWGEMGTKWGINRTVAQIHALLYVSEQPMHAEEICETLSVARSNVSNSIKELQGWGIVRNVHVLGDRRDHFESMEDVWAMFQIVMDERKKREIDPTLAILRECLGEIDARKKDDRLVEQRLRAMLDFFETMSTWYTQIRRLPQGAVIKFVKMGSRIGKLLSTT